MRTSLDQSLRFVYIDEKGNDDDPADRGGRTSDGITQREWDAFCKLHGFPHSDIWTVPWSDKEQVYIASYWQPYCDAMPAGMDYLFFDTNVNSGLHEAVLILQRALGVKADGHIGVVTQAAIQSAVINAAWIDRFCDFHKHFYELEIGAHPTDKKFERGWFNRIEHERSNARQLIA